MKKIITLSLFVIFLLNMYAQKFTSYYDKFDNYKKFDLNFNVTSTQTSLSTSSIFLNASCFLKDNNVNYSLIIHYHNSDWIFIEQGESLVFLVDGERIGLETAGSLDNRTVNGDGTITEVARYSINKEDFEKIVNASSIEFKLSGSNFFVTERVNKKCQRNLSFFYNTYVNKSTDELNKIKIRDIDSFESKRAVKSIAGLMLISILILAIALN